MAGTLGGAELAQGLGFDLADALAGNVEFLTDFFEGVLALAADTEAEADTLRFLGREGLQDTGGFVAAVGIDDGVAGRADPADFDEISAGGCASRGRGRS